MQLEQGLLRLLEVVKGDLKHAHYDRVTALRTTYRRYVTGIDLDKELRIFARRESDELFKQRVEITQPIVKGVLKNITDVYRKVPRSRHSMIIDYQSVPNPDERKSDLEGILSKFWGGNSLYRWLQTRLLELNIIDPNAFVVLEFKPTDGREYAQPYPFEVSSFEAVDFRYDMSALQYLVVKNAAKITDKGATVDRSRWTIYMPNQTAMFVPVDSKGFSRFADGQVFDIGGGLLYIWIGEVLYRVLIAEPHNLGAVPAFRAGYVRDMATDGATFVAPFDAAIELLRKTLKVNSEHDLALALAAYPLTIRYAEPCDAPGCEGGMLIDNSNCKSCGGTGKKRPTSVQEEIVLDLPRHAEDFIDLEKLVVYKAPPVEILKFQQETIDRLTERAKHAVFNSEIFSKNEIVETATGKNIDLQNVYDVLYEYAESLADKWKFAVDAIAKITDLDVGLIRSLTYSRDFKLKTLSELFEDLKQATESGAGPATRQSIQSKIVSTVLVDDQTEFEKYVVKERFNPFSGMSDGEIALALNSDFTPYRHKVLYINLGTIFDVIENDMTGAGRSFYTLPYREQAEIVRRYVDALVIEIRAENTVSGAGIVEKPSLAIQQLSLAMTRAREDGNMQLASDLNDKIQELIAIVGQ